MPGDYNKGDNYSVKEQIEFASFMTQQLDKYGSPLPLMLMIDFTIIRQKTGFPNIKIC